MASASTYVTFTGAEDTKAATWTPITSSFGYFFGLEVTDGSGFVGIDLISLTNGSATVRASARFSGKVYLTFFDV